VMALLGDRNWYLPRWLAWMPRIPHGTPDLPAPAGAPAPADHLIPAGSVTSSDLRPYRG